MGCHELKNRWVREGKGVWLSKGNMKDLCGDGNVLCLDCIHVSTLAVILDFSSVRCHHWEKWVKVQSIPLYSLLQL